MLDAITRNRNIVSMSEDHKFLRFLFKMTLIICVLYAILWFAILQKWEPGDQAQIINEYKAMRHDADTIETPER